MNGCVKVVLRDGSESWPGLVDTRVKPTVSTISFSISSFSGLCFLRLLPLPPPQCYLWSLSSFKDVLCVPDCFTFYPFFFYLKISTWNVRRQGTRCSAVWEAYEWGWTDFGSWCSDVVYFLFCRRRGATQMFWEAISLSKILALLYFPLLLIGGIEMAKEMNRVASGVVSRRVCLCCCSVSKLFIHNICNYVFSNVLPRSLRQYRRVGPQKLGSTLRLWLHFEAVMFAPIRWWPPCAHIVRSLARLTLSTHSP